MDDVTILIPHIPPRAKELTRAVLSTALQQRKPDAIVVVTDNEGAGSAVTRNRGLAMVKTKWVAFLDDDDELLPTHLQLLMRFVRDHDVDVVYPGCRVINPLLGGEIPVQEEWGRFTKPFDAKLLRKKSYIPVTSLVRTELAQRAGFGPPDHNRTSKYDDWGFYVRLLDLGARFEHLPKRTWVWHHGTHNTSGQSWRTL